MSSLLRKLESKSADSSKAYPPMNATAISTKALISAYRLSCTIFALTRKDAVKRRPITAIIAALFKVASTRSTPAVVTTVKKNRERYGLRRKRELIILVNIIPVVFESLKKGLPCLST